MGMLPKMFRPLGLPLLILVVTVAPAHAQTSKPEKIEFDEADMDEIIEFFRTTGTKGKPRNVLVDPKLDKDMAVTLSLHGVTKGVAFAYVAELAGFDYRDDKHALRIYPSRPGAPVGKSFLKKGSHLNWKRATEIKMPMVEFEGDELGKVVRDIAEASRQLDPKKKGINLVLSRGVDASAPVTLKLQDIPVSVVIKYVAEMAGVKMRVDGQAVVFLPKPKPKPKPKD